MLFPQGVPPATCKSVQHTLLAWALRQQSPYLGYSHSWPSRWPLTQACRSTRVSFPHLGSCRSCGPPGHGLGTAGHSQGTLPSWDTLPRPRWPPVSRCSSQEVPQDTRWALGTGREGYHHHHTLKLRQHGRHQLVMRNTPGVCSLSCHLLDSNSITLQGAAQRIFIIFTV